MSFSRPLSSYLSRSLSRSLCLSRRHQLHQLRATHLHQQHHALYLLVSCICIFLVLVFVICIGICLVICFVSVFGLVLFLCLFLVIGFVLVICRVLVLFMCTVSICLLVSLTRSRSRSLSLYRSMSNHPATHLYEQRSLSRCIYRYRSLYVSLHLHGCSTKLAQALMVLKPLSDNHGRATVDVSLSNHGGSHHTAYRSRAVM